ncbi:hypothetical protein [Lacticigenium naphthae]|uniref:hypothetical protein n=1 Tax=Lacticigenium naphthae TaxID=515351 RepID=UPI0004032EF8|nr:hypothetical protein [Lacticigenium naphthae]
MISTPKKTKADELYSQFKKEVDTVIIDDQKDIGMEEIYELMKLSEYDLARALYTAYSLGYSRNADTTSHI